MAPPATHSATPTAGSHPPPMLPCSGGGESERGEGGMRDDEGCELNCDCVYYLLCYDDEYSTVQYILHSYLT